jgi:myo-inositol-1(or 4)-monophosphatase
METEPAGMTALPGALLPIALEAVAIAGELIRSRPPGSLTAKGDRDMASELDYAVERAVRAHLRERTPGVAILGEEEGVTGACGGELLWALDPIDGTANFVHGMPLTGVSLGLLRRDRPVLGVIDLPFLGARYRAVEHTGAYVGDRRITTSRTSGLSDSIVALGDYAVGVGAAEKNRLRLALSEHLAGRVQRVRMLGSAALDLAWVAEGKLDASMTMSNEPWDTAAGVIIAREAGAIVIDQDGSDHTSASAATIAVAPGIVEELLAVVARTQEEVTALRARRGA